MPRPVIPPPIMAQLLYPTEFPELFVAPGCTDSINAIRFLNEQGITHRLHDISRDPLARARLRAATHSEEVPAVLWHGMCLTQFRLFQLEQFIHAHRNVVQPQSA